uniref:KIB1-4 beta-propeller domain-containing protein n=1 Tax=Setaria viridis TaxID=4556 RepID=A0A4U6TKV5_SETVI|nr:hypothetical protein SEVIR_7G002300v2 [Setaria viridis]
MAHSRDNFIDRLPPDLLAEIHGCLGFVDRIVFTIACGVHSWSMLKPEVPCLVHSGVALDRHATACTADPAMHDYIVLGSSAGWLITADAELPAITTIPFLCPLHSGDAFCLHLGPFAEARFGGQSQTADGTYDGACMRLWFYHKVVLSSGSPTSPRSYAAMLIRWSMVGKGSNTSTHTTGSMRLWFYRKVVLSFGSPTSPRSYAAMLILSHHFGAPAFTTVESPGCFEDAIHHDGSFYSATYSGTVEAWDHGGGDCEFVSRVVAPRLAFEENHLSRKYLAAAPNGRLMAMLKYLEEEGRGYNKDMRVSFKAHVLDKKRGRWEETTDIGGAALFVGVNGTLCVPTRDHGGLHLLHRRRCRTGLAAP